MCLEPKVDRLLNSSGRIRRIGLISPYSGGNLGNAAIMSAMITNIKARIADAEILGFTLNPDDTRRRHGIQSFPLAGVSRRHYSLMSSASSETQNRQASQPSRITRWLKQAPILGSFFRAVRNCGMEALHIAAAARVVRRLDRVIVAGGGALDEFWGGPWGHPWSLFKFAMLSRLYQVPLLFVSVGKCSLERPLSRFFVRNALKLAMYRSYRDQASKSAVQDLLYSADDDVCPDLAYSYPITLPAPCSHAIAHKPMVVAVSPIAYCDPRVWPLRDKQRYVRYIFELAATVKWLVNEKHKVLLFATDSPDVEAIVDLHFIIADDPAGAIDVEVVPGPPAQTTEGLLQQLSQADLVIASRLHGILLPHLLAIPVLAISYDKKVDVHMRETGQVGHLVDIERLDSKILIERFSVLSRTREQESVHLARVARAYRDQVTGQYDRLLGAGESSSTVQEYQGQLITA
jgi:polysaccharide pyruvyl transferase WcaK-like protein